MKNLLFGLIATVLFCFNVNAQDINQIGKDDSFKQFIRNDYNLTIKFSNIELLREIYKDKQITKEELPSLYEALNTNEKDYQSYIKSQDLILSALEKKYSISKYSQDELNKILTPQIEIILIESDSIFGNNTISGKRNCKGVYIATLTLNASVAYGAHIGCLGADLTVVGGVLCHGAVAAGQVAANYIAHEDYLDCLNRK